MNTKQKIIILFTSISLIIPTYIGYNYMTVIAPQQWPNQCSKFICYDAFVMPFIGTLAVEVLAGLFGGILYSIFKSYGDN